MQNAQKEMLVEGGSWCWRGRKLLCARRVSTDHSLEHTSSHPGLMHGILHSLTIIGPQVHRNDRLHVNIAKYHLPEAY